MIIPSGQLVSPVFSSLGNAAMPIANNEDMNDSGRKMMVTTVKTSTVYVACQQANENLAVGLTIGY